MSRAGLDGIDTLLLEVGAGLTRIALRRDGALIDLIVEAAGHESRIGWILLGRVIEVSHGLDAAFVDIGAAEPGFLPARAARLLKPEMPAGTPIARLLAEGETHLLQQVKDESAGKGPVLSADIALHSDHLVLTPRLAGVAVSRAIPGKAERARLRRAALDAAQALGLLPQEGIVLRTSAAGLDAANIQAELAMLAARWRAIQARAAPAKPPVVIDRPAGALEQLLPHLAPGTDILCADLAGHTRVTRWCEAHRPELLPHIVRYRGQDPLFEREGVEEEIAAALERSVPLPGGGALAIDPVEALVAIDVNGAERDPREAAFAAVHEVARQLRLRSLSGLILVDFPRLDRRADRDRLIEELRAALAGDRVNTQLLGYTRGGLVEIIRPRDRDTLAHQLAQLRAG
ncbi:ribonuclease E/G [Oceanibaculum nanhaiense]|uniref:ribonuclease E/G n=1 Tax=Oceanibaculum nanhaiense TaxID=1909734 RepID=UPI003F706516